MDSDERTSSTGENESNASERIGPSSDSDEDDDSGMPELLDRSSSSDDAADIDGISSDDDDDDSMPELLSRHNGSSSSSSSSISSINEQQEEENENEEEEEEEAEGLVEFIVERGMNENLAFQFDASQGFHYENNDDDDENDNALRFFAAMGGNDQNNEEGERNEFLSNDWRMPILNDAAGIAALAAAVQRNNAGVPMADDGGVAAASADDTTENYEVSVRQSRHRWPYLSTARTTTPSSTSQNNSTNNNDNDSNKQERQQKEKEYIKTIQKFMALYEEYELQLKALELDEAEMCKGNEGGNDGVLMTRSSLLQVLDAALKIKEEEVEEKVEETKDENEKKTKEEDEKMAVTSLSETLNTTESSSPSPSSSLQVTSSLNDTSKTTPSTILRKNYPKILVDSSNHVGILHRYIPSLDQFEIYSTEIQDNDDSDNTTKNDGIIKVKHNQVALLPPYHATQKDNKDEGSPKWFQALFRVGTKYVGTIQIPNLNSSDHDSDSNDQSNDGSREKYEFVVASHEYQENKDGEEGWKPPILVARHYAYGDEQYIRVLIRLNSEQQQQHATKNEKEEKTSKKEKTIEIEYADGETRCLGSFSPTLGLFQGNVWQLMAGEEGGNNNFLSPGTEGGNKMSGVYYPREDATHTFVLRPCGFGHPKGVVICNDEIMEGKEKKKVSMEGASNDTITDDYLGKCPSLQKILLSPQSISLTKQRSHLNKLSIQLNEYIRAETFKNAIQFISIKQLQHQRQHQEEENEEEPINHSFSLSGATSGLVQPTPFSSEGIRSFNIMQRMRQSMHPHQRRHRHRHSRPATSNEGGEDEEENEETINALLTNLSQIAWSTILINNAVKCTECTCCDFRWYGLLLDVQTFDTVMDKAQFIKINRQDDTGEIIQQHNEGGAKRKVISLKQAHVQWENNCSSVNTIFYCWKQFSNSSNPYRLSEREEKERHTFIIAIHQTRLRLQKNFNILDGAWKRMEKRATEEDIGRWTCRDNDQKEEKAEEKGGKISGLKNALSRRWRKSRNRDSDNEAVEEGEGSMNCTIPNNTDSQDTIEEQEKEEDEVCAICYESIIPTTIDVDDRDNNENNADCAASSKKKACKNKNYPLNLPCGHSFHSLCIRDWFHNHTICPVCRFQLDLLPLPSDTC